MNAFSLDDLTSRDLTNPEAAVRELIARFGLGTTALAFLRLAFQPRLARGRVTHANELSDWLRRDIGLPTRAEDPFGAAEQARQMRPWML